MPTPPISITPLASTNSTDALALANTIMGTGVTVTSATIGGTAEQAGTFSGAIASSSPAWTTIDSGAVFSTGNVVDLIGTPASPNRQTDVASSLDGETNFDLLANGHGSYDVSYIDITFVPTNSFLTIQFLFGSEEYNEYVYGSVSDAIGIWVNNTNIALTPEGKPISIDTINQSGTLTPSQGPSAAPSLFVNNSSSTYSTPMDGLTRTLGATIAVNPGVSNTIRIGIADVGDGIYDSWLLVKADSIQTSTVAFNDNVVTPVNTDVTINVTANDITDSGNPLTTIAIADQTAVVNTPITLASGATVTLQSDGTILYHPVTNSTANDLFGYTVSDGAGNTSTGYVNVAVGLTGPVVTSQTTTDTTPVISGTTSTGLALNSGEVMKVTVNGATYTVVPDSSGNWSVDLGSATPSSGSLTPLSTGTYDVTATVTHGTSVAVDNTHSELIIGSAPIAPTITSPSVNEASPYAIFTVTGEVSQVISLALANGSATGTGTDFGSSTPSNLQYSLDNGATWLDYASAITLTSTSFLVRTPLTNDATYEGAETFTLTATPSVGSAAVGTATIHDDGTGTIYNANGTVNASATPDNDTPAVSMSSVTVSEASPYAVVQVSLSHASTSAISFTPSLTSGTGTVGSDTGSGLEYFNGTAWVSAASGVTIAPGNTSVLLRTTIVGDDIYEGLETISVSTGPLAGPVVSGNSINGVITIADDGSSSNVFNADTNSATPVAGEANNDLKSNDNDGVPESTESGLAQLAGSRTGDLNNDGVPDAQQSAVATLAWINNSNFENAITGKLDSVPTNSIISMTINNANNGLDSNAQIENIQVIPSASLPMPLPANVSTTWDPISFVAAPTGENGLSDADSTRAGTQQKVLININNAGLDKGAFNHYMVYISADTINSYAEAGKPLKDLDGNALTNTAQAGWYDFTARTPGGDGARYITENGKITGIEITTTDGAFGDFSAVNGEFSYYGVPVSAAAQTVTSDSSITLADGIDNLMLNNVSKLAIPSTATCLPDWMAKMAGDAKQPVKTVANLNGTGNSWDNEITGNNGNNKLVGLDGNDTLTGLKGNDVLIGGNGADKLFGGAGNDSFKYLASTDSPSTVGQYDTIEDFQRGHDKIDLRNIDANSNKSGNQAFKLVSALTNHAGQLQLDVNTHLLQGDVNGDGTADFAIEITGVAKLTAADILL